MHTTIMQPSIISKEISIHVLWNKSSTIKSNLKGTASCNIKDILRFMEKSKESEVFLKKNLFSERRFLVPPLYEGGGEHM